MGWLFVCFNPRLHFTSKHWTTPHCTALHYTTLGYKPASLGRYFELPFTVIRYRTRASLSLNWRKKHHAHTHTERRAENSQTRNSQLNFASFYSKVSRAFQPTLSRESLCLSLERDRLPTSASLGGTHALLPLLAKQPAQSRATPTQQRRRPRAALPKMAKNNESAAMANPLGVRLELSLARSPCACP